MRGVPSCFVRVRTNILRQDTSFYIDHFLPFLQRISQIAPRQSGAVIRVGGFRSKTPPLLIGFRFSGEDWALK
ncbi:MAG: hypothetical protein RI932_859, partial [Pseudomonadota bacterium]